MFLLRALILVAFVIANAQCTTNWWEKQTWFPWLSGRPESIYAEDKTPQNPVPISVKVPNPVKNDLSRKPNPNLNEPQPWQGALHNEAKPIKRAPEGQSCTRLQDCKAAWQKTDMEFHPDYMCLQGLCQKYKLPGEHGCVDDIQCNKKCKESFCAQGKEFHNHDGEFQCRCNRNKDNSTMYLYADKCWKKCPMLTVPIKNGLTWECKSTTDANTLQQYIVRSKRQMSRIMC